MTQLNNIDSLRAISVITNLPVSYYDYETDSCIAIWNNLEISKAQAVVLFAEYLGVFMSKTVKESAFNKTCELVRKGAFTKQFIIDDFTSHRHYNYISTQLVEQIKFVSEHCSLSDLKSFMAETGKQ